jgi:hypothetical protein
MLSKQSKEELQKKLLKKLGISPEALRKRIERKASKLSISVDSAYLIFAKEYGLSINRYLKTLTPEERKEIREASGIHNEISSFRETKKERIRKIRKIFHYGKLNLTPEPPLITPQLLQNAEEMSEIYPVLYIFENSLREFILRVLEKKYGPDWWENKVNKEVQEKVKVRIQQEKLNPWHGSRGVHPIFYTDFSDLAKILNHNASDFNPFFKGITGKLHWLTQKLEELKMSRNNIAHTCPLSKKDRERFLLYFDDWNNLINRIIKEI